MTITLSLTLICLNQVHRVTTYHYKKRWWHMQAQPVLFFLNSQLGLILKRSTSTIGFAPHILRSSLS